MEIRSLEEGIAELLKYVQPIAESEEVGLLEALDRVAAEDIAAPMDNPPFDRSPLDGYAFAAADSSGASAAKPAMFRIVGEICAGGSFEGQTGAHEAIRIMTGAKIPAGCDCVIRQEDITLTEQGELLVPYPLAKHQNYCFAGEDIRRGAVLLKKNQVLHAVSIGMLASMGIARIRVRRQPHIVLASTGDEIIDLEEELAEGKIYNSNLYVLVSRLRELGLSVRSLGILPDDAEQVASVLREKAADADLILTTGGVSVGKKDIMHEVVNCLPAKRIFWQLAMKPGSPVLTYQFGTIPGIALSGNPYASLAVFELLVRPVLARLAVNPELMYKRASGVLCTDFLKKSPSRRFVRARWQDGRVTLPGHNSSGMLASAAGCNAMLDVPAGTMSLKAGAEVQVVLL